MTLLLLSFVLTSVGWAALLAFVTWRVALHLRDNPAAVSAVIYAIVELVGRKPEPAVAEPEAATGPEPEAEPQTLEEVVACAAGRNGEVKP